MTEVLMPPQPHIPSHYVRPTVVPRIARMVATDDSARIATFVYAPAGDANTLRNRTDTPILMLHGNGEEHGIFGPTIDAMVATGHTVIAIDARAQGKSTRGRAPLTYELLAADAVTVLDALGIDTTHVLGFSDGGIEALLLARDYPTRVASVTALGANLTPGGVMADPTWDVAALVATNRAWAAHWGNADTRSTSNAGDTTGDVDTVDVNLLTPTPAEAVDTADLLQLMLDEPHIDAASLATIAVPTTIMVGEFDCIADDETCAIVGAIPGAQLVVVPGAGHTLPKHAPDAVTRELAATLKRAEIGIA